MYICRESTVQLYFACSLPLSQFSFFGGHGSQWLDLSSPWSPS